jgi:predicted oxidoreductase
MLKILLNRPEPSVDTVQQHQDFNQILAAFNYQKKVINPWRYWHYPIWMLGFVLLS